MKAIKWDTLPRMTEISHHIAWFQQYAEGKLAECRRDPDPLRLKIAHTLNVLQNAREIASSEGFSHELRRVCLLAAIYHDIGRFAQYNRYGTFKDRDSVNHGLYSVKILKFCRRLQAEEDETRHIVQAAVAWHNRLAIPENLPEKMKMACNVTRDADKLDILRVMSEHLAKPGPYNPTVVLGLPERMDMCSQEVIAAAMSGRAGSYSDLRCVNDFRVLLGSWFFAMNFGSSRRLFIMAGHGENLVQALPDNNFYGQVRTTLLERFQGRKN